MSKKNILALDTSSKSLTLAVQSKDGNCFESSIYGSLRHAEQVIGLIQAGLQATGIDKKNLDVLLCGLGPGSFTGSRIALSVFKGMHMGLRKDVYGASSLDLIALGCDITERELAVCVDARRDRIYVAIYSFKKGKVKKILRDSILSFDQLIGHLKPGMTITGDALDRYGSGIRGRRVKEVSFLNQDFWYPRALFLAELYERRQSWLKLLSLKTMLPKYLRMSEPEEKLKARP